ncbi:hypothetical protein TBLA_0E01040 [Henningerozyma blattae CBS 6284]|uniref:WH1 domain-containing protein n=1 Tax=Henningerozyma blattae (strain ATCC 34711 / CBS 6284 / DSM 70876 / NBRC 10599 / NRRL Y-10934 / UCD 77-7) TaxID=1071380 RepID=I2H462_HENB6|nr:hypothetical protein TBLA_0E01040 [Tetrapisispora blattae CBS 6284]CCH61164.1 hypothetical protein TBLA_0E01040 [Tetrapisispora blattae CBS 6284]
MGLLNTNDKEVIKRSLPKSSNKIIDVAVARLYIAYPNPNEWTYTGLSGAVALVDDLVGNTYFLKLVDIHSNGGVVWDQELYVNFEYNQDRTFFHTFELEECYAGLLFEDISEASHFLKRVQKREKYGSKKTISNKNAIALTNKLKAENANKVVQGPRGESMIDNQRRRYDYSAGPTAPITKNKAPPPPPPGALSNVPGGFANNSSEVTSSDEEETSKSNSPSSKPLRQLPPLDPKFMNNNSGAPPAPPAPPTSQGSPAVTPTSHALPPIQDRPPVVHPTVARESSTASTTPTTPLRSSLPPTPGQQGNNKNALPFPIPAGAQAIAPPLPAGHRPTPKPPSQPGYTNNNNNNNNNDNRNSYNNRNSYDNRNNYDNRNDYDNHNDYNNRNSHDNRNDNYNNNSYNRPTPSLPARNNNGPPPPSRNNNAPLPPARNNGPPPPARNNGPPPPAPRRGPAPPPPPKRHTSSSQQDQMGGYGNNSNRQGSQGPQRRGPAPPPPPRSSRLNQNSYQEIPPPQHNSYQPLPPPQREERNSTPTPPPTTFGQRPSNNYYADNNSSIPPPPPTSFGQRPESNGPPPMPSRNYDQRQQPAPPMPSRNNDQHTNGYGSNPPPPAPPMASRPNDLQMNNNGSVPPPPPPAFLQQPQSNGGGPPPPPPPPPSMSSGDSAPSLPPSSGDTGRDALLASIRSSGIGNLRKVDKSQLDKPSALLREAKGEPSPASSHTTGGGMAPPGSAPGGSLADALAAALNKRKIR